MQFIIRNPIKIIYESIGKANYNLNYLDYLNNICNFGK
nr:MAG TPA: hypothetical protein [Caudoviricetes sp.]